jgi:hypothetical protein
MAGTAVATASIIVDLWQKSRYFDQSTSFQPALWYSDVFVSLSIPCSHIFRLFFVDNAFHSVYTMSATGIQFAFATTPP